LLGSVNINLPVNNPSWECSRRDPTGSERPKAELEHIQKLAGKPPFAARGKLTPMFPFTTAALSPILFVRPAAL
jgi:hypothetical protein